MDIRINRSTLAAVVVCALSSAASTAAALPAPVFEGDARETSESGAVLLRWEAVGDAQSYEVQQSTRSDFSTARVAYRGTFPSAHVSGLAEGEHHFRVRGVDPTRSAWSATKVVDVGYHSMQLVWTLFGLGLLVVAATATVILRGARAHG